MNSFIWKNPANGGAGNISQLEQQVQQLEQQLQGLTTQIQQLRQQLADKAGKAEANNFTQKQKITTPNQALTLVQDNNANFVSFETVNGTRRGYVGMGSSNSHKIHLNGKDGVQISSNAGDIELNPLGNVITNKTLIQPNGVWNETGALTAKILKQKSTTTTFFGLAKKLNNNPGVNNDFELETGKNIIMITSFSAQDGPRIDNDYLRNIRVEGTKIKATWNRSGNAINTIFSFIYSQ